MFEQPLLVLIAQPEVFLPLKRLPQGGDFFRWNEERWRVRDISMPSVDEYGPFREIEAAAHNPSETFLECAGCGGIVSCSDYCRVGLHREPVQASAPRPRKSRSAVLDAPLRKIVHRVGNVETLACGHEVNYQFFKWVDKTAQTRRCLACCEICGDAQRIIKRHRIF